jgi:hypothetical protein
MRLFEMDTIITGVNSSVWLTLDDYKALLLAERTQLRLDSHRAGFALTLTEGEITARIDKPLGEDEGFSIRAGNITIGVRGTVFTVIREGDLVTVTVESGVVAVTDRRGNLLAALVGGETERFDAEAGELLADGETPQQSADAGGTGTEPAPEGGQPVPDTAQPPGTDAPGTDAPTEPGATPTTAPAAPEATPTTAPAQTPTPTQATDTPAPNATPTPAQGTAPTPTQAQQQPPAATATPTPTTAPTPTPVSMPDGYGVWEYYNWRYEGEWKNGKPNGYGTLYWHRSMPLPDDGNPYHLIGTVLIGNFTDGFANGAMTEIQERVDGLRATWSFTANMGTSVEYELQQTIVTDTATHYLSRILDP